MSVTELIAVVIVLSFELYVLWKITMCRCFVFSEDSEKKKKRDSND